MGQGDSPSIFQNSPLMEHGLPWIIFHLFFRKVFQSVSPTGNHVEFLSDNFGGSVFIRSCPRVVLMGSSKRDDPIDHLQGVFSRGLLQGVFSRGS